MAFSDDLARDPKSAKEFWSIIEDTFVQVGRESPLPRTSCWQKKRPLQLC